MSALAVTLLGYWLLGAVAGTMAGLFGVGGGLIIVPALVAVFTFQGLSPDVVMHLAIGTSLATIVVTGISSALGHWRRGSIHFPWFVALLPGLMAGAIMGVLVAGQLTGSLLGMLFGLFVLSMAVKMALGFTPTPNQAVNTPAYAMVLAGSVIGGVSALFGIGGGTLAVPWLSRCGASLTQAVATSAACGVPIALFGAATFIWMGWGHPQLPSWATGYVMWPAFITIVMTSIPFARVGVRLAHRLPSHVLRWAFAALLTVVGLKFLLS
ncbi:sulfite exporter TauE/SafE family protein [Halomonas sp. HL-93]|uniref:sulfite exporter TauE/SafE family protein n=1 Tax=Halomonas sp. HL-93 TaxID=1666906 RepID=UPI0006D9B26F|nr:sulfite exporter TauE/SafE family protein [Halomonas sp. HL-93]KPQ22481.1 MAG: putative permease [Halomonas sp. HL-93]SBR49945.1 hypothetical protein GA0071314_2437 [Halomonas sp. HL-93]